ncbi:hypothetical protein [Paenibacillus donghaensis]|uniref:Uncharacterized protein n=1 Tax=Paenibacillus donghaensis TaxID=414771 RepID=A0A2Z2KI45_9BACL|nr:hypothetical protein [Paenibacillus donghaensis]ASA22870.1 hypothetical protein B9T62_19915 [Paenibacillus donghaensis]
MAENDHVQQEQNHNTTESAEFQNQVTRDFVEDKTGAPVDQGPVSEKTARLSDDQNRLITVHNRRT